MGKGCGLRRRLHAAIVGFLAIVPGCSTPPEPVPPVVDGGSGDLRPPSRSPAWTVLVFQNGDNDLENDAIKDFLEMARVGSTSAVNVVVQLDRTPGKYTEDFGDWTQTLRFRVEKDMKPVVSSALMDLGELDMGDGKVLADFVLWGMASYPADRYALVVWDHGQGWRAASATPVRGTEDEVRAFGLLRRFDREEAGYPAIPAAGEVPLDHVVESSFRSVSSDETSGSKIYNREMQDALESALAGRRLDVLCFDACCMGMIETGFAMRNVAGFMVASEELVPGTGLDYASWLRPLADRPATDGEALSRILVDSYRGTYGEDNDTTMSAVDLLQAESLADAVSGLADAMRVSMEQEWSPILKARGQCSRYGSRYGFHGVDLVRFCERIRESSADPLIQNAAGVAGKALARAVRADYAGRPRQGSFGSKGIAVYFPLNRFAWSKDPDGPAYVEGCPVYPLEFVEEHGWDNFLQAFFQRVP